MDILSALDGPVSVSVKGKTYQFLLWTTRQLLPVLSRLKAKRLELCKKHLLAEGVDGLHRARALYEEDMRPTDPFDAHIHFQSADGVDECLVESLKRNGIPETEALEVVDSILFSEKQRLALLVAHIYQPAPPQVPATAASTATPGQGLGEGKAPEQPPGLGEGSPALPTAPALAGT